VSGFVFRPEKGRVLVAPRLGEKRRDGSVTVLAEGYKENLNEFSSWLRKGPPGSWVREFEMEELPYTGSFIDFEIEY
jgi:acylphosphatase